MKIFELRPIENLKDNDNPWNPWYDKSFGFIVRAETEAEARKHADENAGGENVGHNNPWLDEKYSTCVELNSNGEAGVIMQELAKS